MKFITKYGLFALSVFALLIVGLLFQWFVFGELAANEQWMVGVVALVAYIPFVILAIRDRVVG